MGSLSGEKVCWKGTPGLGTPPGSDSGSGCGIKTRDQGFRGCITARTLNYGNYGIFIIMGNAGLISSTVGLRVERLGTLNPCSGKPSNP